MNWNEYFIEIARIVSEKSKDPSTKIGAVIVGTANQILSTGFNGFPRGIDEKLSTRWERPIKYSYMCHAEVNAILNAARHGVSLEGSTLYLRGFGPPTVPCVECTKAVIQAGIKTVIGKSFKPVDEHWREDLEFAYNLLKEAGVDFREI